MRSGLFAGSRRNWTYSIKPRSNWPTRKHRWPCSTPSEMTMSSAHSSATRLSRCESPSGASRLRSLVVGAVTLAMSVAGNVRPAVERDSIPAEVAEASRSGRPSCPSPPAVAVPAPAPVPPVPQSVPMSTPVAQPPPPHHCRRPRCRHRKPVVQVRQPAPQRVIAAARPRLRSKNHSEHPRPSSSSLTYPKHFLSRPRSQRRRPRPCSRHQYRRPRCRRRPSRRRLSAPPLRTRLPRRRRGPHRGCRLGHRHPNSKPLNLSRVVNGCRIPSGLSKRSRNRRTSLRPDCRFFWASTASTRRSGRRKSLSGHPKSRSRHHKSHSGHHR